MKISGILIFLLYIPFGIKVPDIDLEYLRRHYTKAVNDKVLCQRLIEELDIKEPDAIFLGYLGGLQTIRASHLSNPISKLKAFNTGKRSIEKAISIDRENVELRFIRYSVQKNAPSFLGYSRNMDEDIAFIEKNRGDIDSPVLLKNIDGLSKDGP